MVRVVRRRPRKASLEGKRRAHEGRRKKYADQSARVLDTTTCGCAVIRKMPEVVESYRVTCPACPLQVEGRLVDGRHFYLHLRYNTASLGIGDSPEEAVIGACHDDRSGGVGSEPNPAWGSSIGIQIRVGDPASPEQHSTMNLDDDQTGDLIETLFEELEQAPSWTENQL